MLNFCTLFDSNYLSRGLAMYESLKKHCIDFHIFIFPFDDKCHEILLSLQLENVTLVSLKEFENEKLLSVKNTRTKGEYCWTCTSWTILYVLEKYNISSCTYLDADLFFFNSPQKLVDEIGLNSVIITEHRYSDRYSHSIIHGKFCVQFMTFKNDNYGLRVLKDWANNCIDWCYARVEEGKFGDQKYLDNWPREYNEHVHILEHEGGGLAPWNIQQYVLVNDSGLKLINKKTKKISDVIFYHFHGLNFFNNNIVRVTNNYRINQKVIQYIYSPYVKQLEEIKTALLLKFDNISPHGNSINPNIQLTTFFDFLLELTHNVIFKQNIVLKLKLVLDFILNKNKSNCYTIKYIIKKGTRYGAN
jgi:hypothetical protein